MTGRNQTIALIAGGVLIGGVGAAVLASRSGPNDTAPKPVQMEEAGAKPSPDSVLTSPPSSDSELATVQSAEPGQEVQHQSEDLHFTATFPEAANMRRVAAALRTETATYLNRARNEAQSAGRNSSMPQWEIKIDWEVVATANGYASLLGRSYEYRGGAHPIELVDTKLMRLDSGQEIKQSEMFSSRGWPTPAVAIAVCEALKGAKTERVGAQTIFDEPIVCSGASNNINLDEAKLAFAASQSGEGFGGLHVFYQPYIVGSYAEGSYEFTIPSEVFLEDVAKEYRQLFTGDPAPLVD